MSPTLENLELFTTSTIENLDWSNSPDSQFTQKLLFPLVKKGIPYYIDNIHADAYALKMRDQILPVIVTHENYKDAYVCSPYGHYITLGVEHTKVIQNKILGRILGCLQSRLGKICQKGHLNSAVYINNWLFSTDLYRGKISSDEIQDLCHFFQLKFPKHAIIWRSLNTKTNGPLQLSLKQQGFDLIPSRYVYIIDAAQEALFESRIFKSDLKLLRETKFEILQENEIVPSDCAAMLNLYHNLYVAQHSTLQPQYNKRYLELLFNQKFLRFKAIAHQRQIIGVAGYYVCDGVMMCPFFGYDKYHVDHNIIYRLLNTELILEAQKQNLLFHLSAGASFFKKLRKAEGYLEYMAVYTRHLPYKQKLPWKLLNIVMNHIGSKYMKEY